MARKEKTRVTVQLPAAFTDFMRVVHDLIVSGDEATTIESDDLLQCDAVYGGLYNAERKRFGFCYFHNDGGEWDFALDAEQIAAIASGTTTSVELWQCSSETCNCHYSREDSYCPNCDSVRHFDNYEERLRDWYPGMDEAAIREMMNLRKIGLAISDYESEHGHFPRPFTVASDGTRLHSWRSLILPFLDCDELFEKINFEEPWDSASNRAVWGHQPEVFRSATGQASQTGCVAIVDEQTMWPTGSQRIRGDVTSGYSYTVTAVRSEVSSVNWMEPADIDLETAMEEYATRKSFLAVFMDCHVDTIRDVDSDRFRELVCI